MKHSYYRPQTKFAKVMVLYLSVSHSVHKGGLHKGRGSASRGGSESRGGSASRGVGQILPSNRILRDTVNERAVHILLECILVFLCVSNIEKLLDI